MFNSKFELQEKVKQLEYEIKSKDNLISMLREKIKTIEEHISNTPADCILGKHCEACHFAKVFHIPGTFAYSTFRKVYVCGRNGICPNFVKKSYVKEED